ncbi:MAG: peptidylprolyl isomerase [Phycisphaerae bacterium]|nr:peptidylprolyl isomerase [Phycisphaerae bacterium]
MKWFLIIIMVICLAGSADFAVAQTETPAAAAPTTASTTAPASAPAEEGKDELPEDPEDPEGVVARVGEAKIQTQDLATILDKIPYRLSKKKRKEVWASALESLIYQELLHSYLEASKAPDAPEELAQLKEKLAEEVEKYNQTASLRLLPPVTTFEMMERRGLNERRLADQARYERLILAMTTNEQLLAFMNKHPEYFNGTKVHVGHIFLACSPLAPTAEQKKVVEKLQQIAADIRAGKVTFAQAANEHSECPSGKVKGWDGKADYGDLGNLMFYQLAGVYGATVGAAAFGADVGSLSDVIRSPQGFHLIKVFDQTKGNESPTAESAGIARFAVSSLLENQVFNQGLENAPIVIYKASRKVPKAKKD